MRRDDYSQQQHDSIKIGEWEFFVCFENIFFSRLFSFVFHLFFFYSTCFLQLKNKNWRRRNFFFHFNDDDGNSQQPHMYTIFFVSVSDWTVFFSFLFLIFIWMSFLSLQVVSLMMFKKQSLFSNMPYGRQTNKCITQRWDDWVLVIFWWFFY